MLKIKTILITLLSLYTFTAFACNTLQMSQQELVSTLEKKTDKVVLLDVRSEDEFNRGHIEGAINISHDKIDENIAQLSQYKNTTIVVYCRSGRRAAIAEDILKTNDFSDIRHLTGDMNAWVASKLPVVSKE